MQSPTLAKNPTFQNIQQMVSDITAAAVANPSPRALAEAIEANQLLAEYLDELKDHIHFEDEGITVDVEGERVHFQNSDDFAEWMAGEMS